MDAKLMPRNPANKRIEFLVSPEQYQALLRAAELEGYITIVSGTLETEGSVSEYVRDLLDWHVPGFKDAKPLVARGKYKRK